MTKKRRGSGLTGSDFLTLMSTFSCLYRLERERGQEKYVNGKVGIRWGVTLSTRTIAIYSFNYYYYYFFTLFTFKLKVKVGNEKVSVSKS